jgi:hypothetical protein
MLFERGREVVERRRISRIEHHRSQLAALATSTSGHNYVRALSVREPRVGVPGSYERDHFRVDLPLEQHAAIVVEIRHHLIRSSKGDAKGHCKMGKLARVVASDVLWKSKDELSKHTVESLDQIYKD